MSSTSTFSVISGEANCPFVFSCEHASAAIPTPPSLADQSFLHTHWGVDIGAKGVVEELCSITHSAGILSVFSRLWVDLNRPVQATDLIRQEVEQQSISFNRGLTSQQIDERIAEYYTPYHNAFGDLVAERARSSVPFLLVSVHSFTPIWSGSLRTMDVGVLFNHHEELAERLQYFLQQEELFTALNQPYSGKNASGTVGLIHSVEQQGLHHRIPYLELEINQALISTPEREKHIAHKIARALQQLHSTLYC